MNPTTERVARRWGDIVLNVGVGLAIIAVGLSAARSVEGATTCQFADALLPDLFLYVVGVIAFFAGGFFDRQGLVPTAGAGRQESRNLGRWAMACVFLALALVMFFEAVGTARYASSDELRFEPITHYVRCAIYQDKLTSGGNLTAVAVFFTCFIGGQLLLGAAQPRPKRSS